MNENKTDKILQDIERGSLITIGGRPAMGKTTFALNLIEQFCKQKKFCLLFSDEMSRVELVQRLLTQISGIDFDIEPLEQELSKIIETIKIISKWNLCLYNTISYEDIEQTIKQQKVDYVFIDIKDSYKWVKDLKQLAKEYNIVIFIISKVKRYKNRL